MTAVTPDTAFLRKLDEQNLQVVTDRIKVLEPLVGEYKECIARQRFLERRLGVTSRAQRLRDLLAEHPRGLTRAAIGEALGMESNALSGVIGELKKRGQITSPRHGFYRLADPGDGAGDHGVDPEAPG